MTVLKMPIWHPNNMQEITRDITSIVMTLGDEIDYSYIEMWFIEKGVVNIWRELVTKIRYRRGENQTLP